jgi:hypothetical protein
LLQLLAAGFGPVPTSVYITTCPQLAKAAVRAADEGFAVGTLIAERPPHRAARAEFPHAAPTLGV